MFTKRGPTEEALQYHYTENSMQIYDEWDGWCVLTQKALLDILLNDPVPNRL